VQVHLPALVCDAYSFGAVGDGVTDDTRALQAAITACAAGGTALLPSNGTFLSFGLALPASAANFALQIDGALRFSNDTKAWGPAGSAGACLALAGSSIALLGAGTVDGQGAAWWPCAKAGCARPTLVKAQGVAGLLVTGGLTFKDSPNHQLELYASPFEVSHVSILAPPSTGSSSLISHNTDGIDVHGQPAYIHHVHISTGDDHIALHANDTLVESCTFGTGHGTSIGSLGANTYLRNISIIDSTFEAPTCVARIKADTQSSGFLRDVLWRNISATGATITLQLTTNYPAPGAGTGTLAISNVTFADIASAGSAEAGQFLCSANAPCQGITLRNVVHTAPPAKAKGWSCAAAHGATAGTVSPPIACLLP
jgi:polygalacturonase